MSVISVTPVTFTNKGVNLIGKMEKVRAAKCHPHAKVDFGDEDAAGLTKAKQRAFVREYVVDWNGAAAAKRAGYSEASAKEIASELLTFPHIRAGVARRQSEIAAVAEVDAALVISELYSVALADPRDLMSVTVDSCRYCYGIDHGYQWTRAQYKRELNKALAAAELAPDLEGGIGFA